jgi:folate-dependent phosphoribosylglycinamide formyltransferase PurN
MKLILITGDHLRHYYVASQLDKVFSEIIWIVEKRELQVPKKNKKIKKKFQRLLELHFRKRIKAEKKFFGEKYKYNFQNIIKKISIDRKHFNKKIEVLLKKERAEVLITYGCGKISNQILKNKNIKNFFNIHGGLSPWFKGSITNFWPSYLLKPQYTGMTLHTLTSKIDGGDILLQCTSKLYKNDGIHDLSCRVIKNFCYLTKKKFKKINFKIKIIGVKQKFSGKIWKKCDWNYANLEIIYNKFNDKINYFVLKNKLNKQKPELINIL